MTSFHFAQPNANFGLIETSNCTPSVRVREQWSLFQLCVCFGCVSQSPHSIAYAHTNTHTHTEPIMTRRPRCVMHQLCTSARTHTVLHCNQLDKQWRKRQAKTNPHRVVVHDRRVHDTRRVRKCEIDCNRMRSEIATISERQDVKPRHISIMH